MKLKEGEWEILVQRKGDFLKNYLLYAGYSENFKQAFGMLPVDLVTSRKMDNFTHYIRQEDKIRFCRQVDKKIRKNRDFLSMVLKKGNAEFAKLSDISARISKISNSRLKKMPKEDLSLLLESYFDAYITAYPYFHMSVYYEPTPLGKKMLHQISKFRFMCRSRFDLSHKLASNIFAEAARRLSLANKDVKCLTMAEIMEMLAGRRLNAKRLISKRRFCIFSSIKGHFQLLENAKLDFARRKATNVQSLKGQCAYPGKARGIARIIKDREDLRKIKGKDIILSTMLTPSMVDGGFAKPAAIVTDEGSMTCHAAIIARERKIPCLVGTKNCTTVFRDGDRLHVDATGGSVRKAL